MDQKTALVLLPTFSQTIEQRICSGLDEVLNNENIRLLHAPLGYLSAEQNDLTSVLWVHQLLRSLEPDMVFAYGGGLAYRSTDEIYRAVLDIYRGIPIINIGNVVADVPSVVAENYQGMKEMLSNVVGRRADADFVFIRGPEHNQDSQLRFQALGEALAEHGRRLEDIRVLPGDFSAYTGEVQMKAFLDDYQGNGGVVICANDLTAKGVIDALDKTGFQCPGDFWVTGFDDFEYAASMNPSLTTVHFPARSMGVAAAKLCMQYLEAPEQPLPMITEIAGYPIYRQSTEDSDPGLQPKQLIEQWAVIQLRDNSALQLTLLRELKRNQPVQDLLRSADHALAELSVSHLSLFLRKLSEDGLYHFTEMSKVGARQVASEGTLTLPQVYHDVREGYWMLCPLQVGAERFGLLMANTTKAAAEFVEFITPQFADLLHAEVLEERNENYRVQNELNERMASLGTLVSGVAHEVNTPIGTGKLASSSLKDEVGEVMGKVQQGLLTRTDFERFMADVQEYSTIIYQSLDRAANLISNFKMVSVDQTAEQKRQFDLGQYIDSILISLRHQLKGTSIELVTELTEGILVDTFPGAVAQVVTNLFMNSLKHGFDNATIAGEISIRLREHSDGFRLEVADSGLGATPEVLSHIFDPFYTTTRGAGGSGLGMHIVYNLLNQKLNWDIRLQSEPGLGFKAIMQPARRG